MSSALDSNAQVSDDLMGRFCDLIYRVAGVRISPQKTALMSNRLRRRLRPCKLSTFEEYYRLLQSARPSDPEWDFFLQEITTHETYLFRDPSHWQWLQQKFLPDRLAAAQLGKGPTSLRIWSAACSTGDEAFTIACCVASALPTFKAWKIQIVGTDIGIGAVKQAQQGVFNERAMRLVPEAYRQQFFTPLAEGSWQANQSLRDLTQFRQHNLLDPFLQPRFDLIVLKNVLIYFDAASKERVINNLRSALVPGGLLLAGSAEGVGDWLKEWPRVQPWLYQLPGKRSATGEV